MENKENNLARHYPDSTEKQGAEAWLDKNASNAEEVRITENKWTKHSTLEAEKIEWSQKEKTERKDQTVIWIMSENFHNWGKDTDTQV